ncbi:MAG: class I SAM-dependent methyltransferase [Oscillochloris sp.]|nr:class I SAM-dependent methyltransferase [Oscillochloris sp.]
MTSSPATLFETVACPMCGADRPEILFSGGDLLHQAAETFRLVTCERCGHIYQNPRPTEAAIGRFYPDNYIAFQGAIEDEPNPLRRIERRYGQSMRCGAVHRAARKPGTILDIGCATGIFLDGMRRRGWQTVGIEPSEHAADYARNRLGLEVYTGRLEDVALPEAGFDAISMWDVLEHVHEPQRVLREVARLLRPGGRLILSLPNPDSLEARLLGEHWLGWDLPRHLNLFRPPLLRGILARHGMPVERIRSFTAGHSVLTMSLVQRARAPTGTSA